MDLPSANKGDLFGTNESDHTTLEILRFLRSPPAHSIISVYIYLE
jgi:hypothetical protein